MCKLGRGSREGEHLTCLLVVNHSTEIFNTIRVRTPTTSPAKASRTFFRRRSLAILLPTRSLWKERRILPEIPSFRAIGVKQAEKFLGYGGEQRPHNVWLSKVPLDRVAKTKDNTASMKRDKNR